jgi:hypothetical protein
MNYKHVDPYDGLHCPFRCWEPEASEYSCNVSGGRLCFRQFSEKSIGATDGYDRCPLLDSVLIVSLPVESVQLGRARNLLVELLRAIPDRVKGDHFVSKAIKKTEEFINYLKSTDPK